MVFKLLNKTRRKSTHSQNKILSLRTDIGEYLINISGTVLGPENISKMNKRDTFPARISLDPSKAITGCFGGIQQETCPQINS
jgi:hypothetical protein